MLFLVQLLIRHVHNLQQAGVAENLGRARKPDNAHIKRRLQHEVQLQAIGGWLYLQFNFAEPPSLLKGVYAGADFLPGKRLAGSLLYFAAVALNVHSRIGNELHRCHRLPFIRSILFDLPEQRQREKDDDGKPAHRENSARCLARILRCGPA